MIWELLEILGGLCEFVSGWRFWICILLGVVAIALIEQGISNDNVSVALSVPVGVIALGAGVIWDWRSR